VSLRSLARASALYTFGNIAPRIGAFILLPIYVTFLSPADYGTLALLASLAGVLAIVYHLGLDASLMRLHFDTEGRARGSLYGSSTLFTLSLASLLTIVLAVTIGPFFEQLFAGTPFIPLGALALLVALVSSVGYVPSTLFRASGQANRFLLVNLGAFIISSVVSVTLVVVFGLGATGVLTGQLIGSTAVAIVALAIVARLGTWTIDLNALRPALRLGLPLLPHAISGWALRLADRWLIVAFIGLPALDARAQVGVYSLGYQLGFIVSIVLQSFNSAWSPYFYRSGSADEGPRLHGAMTTLVIGGLLVLAVGVSTLAPEIVAIAARPDYNQAADVVPVIAFAYAIQGLYVMFVAAAFLMKRTERLAPITFGAAILNVALNVVLVPAFGIMGAAWATLGAYLFFAGATYLLGRRLYPLRVDAWTLAFLAAGAIAVVLVSRVLPGPSPAAGAFHLLLAVGYAGVVAFVCRGPMSRLRSAERALRTARG
jgi:O-antigen/teichoic acid export membrane protein